MKTRKNVHSFLALVLILAGPSVFAQIPPALNCQLYAGVTITGATGSVYAIQTTSNLADSNSWLCVGLMQLTGTNVFWTDTSKSAATGQRFYRTVLTATNLAWILPGTFTMGSPTNEALRGTDEVQHVVTISKGFYLGKYLVTQAEYLATVGDNPSYFASPRYSDNLQRPVDYAPWIDATNYCALRTAQERAAGLIPTNWTYRLPTESEWEYACRAGTVMALYLGSALHSQQANFVGTNEYDSVIGSIYNPSGVNLQITSTVGSYAPNGWGLYDMAGNLAEFCSDWYGAYPTGNVVDPQGPASGGLRVRRGGSWQDSGNNSRSAVRLKITQTGHSDLVGFRVVLAQVQ